MRTRRHVLLARQRTIAPSRNLARSPSTVEPIRLRVRPISRKQLVPTAAHRRPAGSTNGTSVIRADDGIRTHDPNLGKVGTLQSLDQVRARSSSTNGSAKSEWCLTGRQPKHLGGKLGGKSPSGGIVPQCTHGRDRSASDEAEDRETWPAGGSCPSNGGHLAALVHRAGVPHRQRVAMDLHAQGHKVNGGSVL